MANDRTLNDAMYRFMSSFYTAVSAATNLDGGLFGRRVKATFGGVCRMINPTLFLEIGAYEAGFSRWVKQAMPDCRCLAYEANPFVFERFREEVQAAGVEYFNKCVSSAKDTVKLNVPTDFRDTPRALDNQMASLQLNLSTKNHRVVDVEAVRLDEEVTLSADDRIAAWIDVEGACEQVLQGGQKVLSKASAIYIEVESKPMWEGQWLDTDVARFFMDLGFVPIMRDRQRPQQFNLVFVSSDLATSPNIARRAAYVFESKSVVSN